MIGVKNVHSMWFWLLVQIFVITFVYLMLFRQTTPKDSLTEKVCPTSEVTSSLNIHEIPKLTFKRNLKSLPLQEEKHDKWIIVTSVNYPTDSIRALASLSGFL